MIFKKIAILGLISIVLTGCLSAEQLEKTRVKREIANEITQEKREQAKIKERAAAFEKRQQSKLIAKEKEAPFRAEISKTTPKCQSKEECDIKMEAAYLWVSKNADYKIRSSNNVLIETYGPSHADGEVAITVEKTPLSTGKYAIVASMACNNPSMFAEYSPLTSCKDNLLKKTIEFNNFVNGY